MRTLTARLDRLESVGYGGPEIVHVVLAYANAETSAETSGRREHPPTAEERSIVEAAIRREGLSPVAVWEPDDSPESVLARARGMPRQAGVPLWRNGHTRRSA